MTDLNLSARRGRPLSRRRGRTGARPNLHPLALALAAAAVLVATPGIADPRALPGGLNVVSGRATAVTQGSRMTVTNSAGAILNWQSFNIGASNAVRFDQPDASSRVLNRVVGNDASAILGRLSSNGQVWLLNPHGVLFGAGAQVDVGGLVTSTLQIRDGDWLAQRFSLLQAPGSAFGGAKIVNRGTLRTTGGGQVLLIGGSGGVHNEGLIDSAGGQVLLAAGSSVDLVDTALPNLAVRVSAPAGQALNLGEIVAAGGRIDLHAAVVNQHGIVRADGIGAGAGGAVLLQGRDAVNSSAGSLTSADGAVGGSVQVDAGAGGTALLAGQTRAVGSAGAGGDITLLGRHVGLLDGAQVDASGAAGGGQVRVGGGLQGRDPSLRNAEAVFMAAGAGIRADAGTDGDGGRVILWSDRATRAFGTLSARGGSSGGDGGFIETSGGWLDARPASVRTDAAHGLAGQWLLDPDDIVITNDTGDSGITGGPDFTSVSSPALISTATIVAALNADNNVSVTTGSSGEGNGDIDVVLADIKPAPGVPVSLTLNADRNIVLDFATIRSDGAALTLKLVSGASGEGAVAVRSSSVFTAGGDIVIGGTASPCSEGCSDGRVGSVGTDFTGLRDGISVSASALDAGTGTITMSGHSNAVGADASGVAIIEGATLNGRRIEIDGSIEAASDYFRTGVKLAGGVITASDYLQVSGLALSSSYSFDAYPVGVDVLSELRVTGGAGESGMYIQGSVSDGPRSEIPGLPVLRRFGVGIRGGSGKLVAGAGAGIDIVGTDLSSNGDYGIYAAGSTADFLDASAGGLLRLRAQGDLLLAGEVLAPVGGTLQASASANLTVAAARLGGDAAEVSLSAADALVVGGSSEATQLVFDSSTEVDLQGGSVYIGTPRAAAPEGGTIDAFGARVGDARALEISPPSANTLIAAGGPIRVQGNRIELGGDTALYSEAADDAIVFTGGGESAAPVSEFRNAGATLGTPAGRWLIYTLAPEGGEGSFDPGGLRADFRQYDAVPGSTVLGSGNGFLFQLAPSLFLAGEGGSIAKEYDGTDSVDLASFGYSLGGLVGGDTVTGSVRFDDRNAGVDKPLVLAADGGTGIVDAFGAPVYGYRVDSTGLVGDITPRPLSLTAISVADKVYDAGTAATVTAWTLDGVIAGDDVRVDDTAAAFADPNVGAGKTVSARVSSLTGADIGNYALVPEAVATGTASITPATLVYRADPASMEAGSPLPALSGSVTGFVGGETLASATTGTLAFVTEATPASEPGLYAIDGSGLSAVNYLFTQAAGNATALTVAAAPTPPPLPPPPPFVPPVEPDVAVTAVAVLLPPPAETSPQQGRALDVVQALQPAGTSEGSTFSSLDLDNLSQETVAAVLAAREQYKKTVFAQALAQLEQNPQLADASGCATAEQATSGQCLMISALGPGAAAISNARVEQQSPVSAPGAAPTPAPPPAVSTPVTPSPAPAPAATAAGGAQADAALARLPEVTLQLPARRDVIAANVPQIERKVALVIGIDTYSDPRIPRLGNAVKDARAVAESLERNLGYQTLVLENATRRTLFSALNRLAVETGPNDSIVVYYAGHGQLVESTGFGYWQPADADPDRPETWISNADIGRLLRQLPATQVAMISDSCFSGSLADERIRGIVVQDPNQLLKQRAAVVMTSGGNEPVFDSGRNGHSPFAWSLMESLAKVSTWKPGSSLFEQVRFDVARRLPQRPQYGASRAGGHQAGADYLFEQRQLGGVAR